MKGDFTRDTFDPLKHFSRVLMQQGRVTLDADYNEQAAILLYYLRTLARDLIGPYAAPVEHRGFWLGPDAASGAIAISAGRYYVDGILVENQQDCLYGAQPDYRAPQDDPLVKELSSQAHGNTVFWLYLDVWERHVTAIEDDSMREKALNGPDTCTRTKVTWQVKALAVGKAVEAKIAELKQEAERIKKNDPPSEADKKRLDEIQKQIDELTAFVDKLPPPQDGELDPAVCGTPLTLLTGTPALLSARVDPGKKEEDACVTPPDAKYRGIENQLYRVEIHNGGAAGAATFKWSRNNGSVATAWVGTSGYDLTVAHSRGFEAGVWIELSNETLDLLGQPGMLVKVAKVEGDTLTLDPSTVPAAGVGWSEQLIHPKVRRWDQRGNQSTILKQGAVPVKEGVWLDMEDGIQIKFASGGEYRTGDYWLIPARVATGGIEWPVTDGTADAEPARGIEHHYAPLGFVWWTNNSLRLRNCGCEFVPLSSCFEEEGERRAAPARPTGRRRRGGSG